MNDTNQSQLIFTSNTWMHFIGGYYSNTEKFINEAIKSRISRRAPAQMVRAMEFGDRLVLLRYGGPDITSAFAEAQIVGVTLDHEIAQIVGDQLHCEFRPSADGGTEIQRECGSYTVFGVWIVKASLGEVMEIAMKAAKERGDEPLFVMVNAELTKVYDAPTFLSPAPKFTRGFIKVADQAAYSLSPIDPVSQKIVIAINDYQKKQRIKRGRPMLIGPTDQ
jgi:hypothetical protein